MSTDDSASFSLSNVLTPGSSLHPTLLLFLDVCFGALLGVLGTLLVLTRGNIHFIFLIFIELCLWASVKWVVTELRRAPPLAADTQTGAQDTDKVKQD